LYFQEAEDGGRDEQSLLSEHLANWRAAKTKWMHAGHLNERRYSESISIIEEIYKRYVPTFYQKIYNVLL
jgi:hypothetical protein